MATVWKPSVFNVLLPHAGRFVLFNSVSGNVLTLSAAQHAIVVNAFAALERVPELARGLATLGFAVDAALDEREAERQRYLQTCRARDQLFLTIAPTMKCNLRCTYCFQQEIARAGRMSDAVRDGVIELVRRKAPETKKLVVQWFGGEPLLAWQTILDLTDAFREICGDRIAYHSEMLTNGTLLRDELIAAIPRLALKAIQIPLDGVPSTYAERKRVPLRKAEAFYDALFRQINAIVELTGSVTLRINVDRDNPGAGKEVVRMLGQYGVRDSRIDFRLGFLNTSRGVIDCIPHDCLSDPEFADLEQEFREFLAVEGLMVYGMPGRMRYPCTTPLVNAFTIDPEGRIGKCVPSTGTDATTFSRIYPGDVDRTLSELDAIEAPFARFDPFDADYCRDCAMLPSCLGACPKVHEPGAVMRCGMRQGLAGKLAFYADFHAGRAARQTKEL